MRGRTGPPASVAPLDCGDPRAYPLFVADGRGVRRWPLDDSAAVLMHAQPRTARFARPRFSASKSPDDLVGGLCRRPPLRLVQPVFPAMAVPVQIGEDQIVLVATWGVQRWIRDVRPGELFV